jgi:hypothetical protein
MNNITYIWELQDISVKISSHPSSTTLLTRGQYYCSRRNIPCNTESVNYMSLYFRTIRKAKNLKPYFIHPNKCNLSFDCVILRQQNNEKERSKAVQTQ